LPLVADLLGLGLLDRGAHTRGRHPPARQARPHWRRSTPAGEGDAAPGVCALWQGILPLCPRRRPRPLLVRLCQKSRPVDLGVCREWCGEFTLG